MSYPLAEHENTRSSQIMDRKRLETTIEKHIHGLVNEVKESTVDFTVLTVRKRYPDIDRDHLSIILDVVRTGIDNGFMTSIDRYMTRLDKDLTELTASDVPLEIGRITPDPKTKTKKSKSVKA